MENLCYKQNSREKSTFPNYPYTRLAADTNCSRRLVGNSTFAPNIKDSSHLNVYFFAASILREDYLLFFSDITDHVDVCTRKIFFLLMLFQASKYNLAASISVNIIVKACARCSGVHVARPVSIPHTRVHCHITTTPALICIPSVFMSSIVSLVDRRLVYVS